jgi:HTH-type transcriptional regulator, competence development regulator
MADPTLATVLRGARQRRGMSLRDVERAVGIRNAHLSQLETGTIARPDLALLWDLSELYEVEFGRLAQLAGYAADSASGRTLDMTVALRALRELTDDDRAKALRYIAELRRNHRDV